MGPADQRSHADETNRHNEQANDVKNSFQPETRPDAATSGQALDIYCIAIGGTGMAPLAALLKGMGHRVRGADGPLYPPMSTLLAEAGIEPHVGYDAGHLSPAPDLAIVGNAVPRSNVEAQEVERQGLARMSMPEALSHFLLTSRRPLVVAGTHGKTTTTAMAAWVFRCCRAAPSFLIGGVPQDLGVSFHLGGGDRFILEGDEYNAAYFDRGAKFLHYRPETLILTSAEYDHADLYPTPESLLDAYGRLVELVPPSGRLIACGDWPSVVELACRSAAPVSFYGLGKANAVRPDGPVVADDKGIRFSINDPESGRVEVHLPCWGDHNLANALAVWAAARAEGLEAAAIAAAFAGFHGVQRRLDEIGTAAGVTVVDDFAHHPTAVDTTLAGLKRRYPGRRVVVLYEPRSLTAGRSMFRQPYLEAFAQAEVVLFAPLFHQHRLGEDERLDLPGLVRDLKALGCEAAAPPSNHELLAAALERLAPGDVVVTMSSGSFDGMPRRLLEALRSRQRALEQAAAG